MPRKPVLPPGFETTEAALHLVEVRALVDRPDLGLVCGRLARVPAAVAAALAAAHQADPHPDAVAYARAQEH